MKPIDINKLVKDIRMTLIARIIPSLPIAPNTNDGKDRDRIREIINKFEFGWYLEQAHRAGRQEILKEIEQDLVWCIITAWNDEEGMFEEDVVNRLRKMLHEIDKFKKEAKP